MIFNPNDLFYKMASLVENKPKESKLIIVNEGSTRSSKTFDAIHLITYLCRSEKTRKLDIFLFRDSLVNCKEFLLKDFKDCLKSMQIWNDSNLRGANQKPDYNLYGHLIKFRGLDDNSLQTKEATGSDIIFFNEALSGCEKEPVYGWMMRCRSLVLIDYNPKYTAHWVFDMEKRDDTVFIKSTYKNNKHLEASVIKEIESYNPDVPYIVETGTADAFRWKVYGLGERANREGLVFPNGTWIDSFPTDIDEISYGCDFGQANPTAIVKTGVRRREFKHDLYIQKLFYAPTETSDIVAEVMHAIAKQQIAETIKDKTFKTERKTFEENIETIVSKVHCDSNMGIETGWISDLRNKGISAFGTAKYPGSRNYWISTINRYNIHIVKDIDFRKEQENFCYRVIDGVTVSETIKKYDHLWSASGYSVVGDFRNE